MVQQIPFWRVKLGADVALVIGTQPPPPHYVAPSAKGFSPITLFLIGPGRRVKCEAPHSKHPPLLLVPRGRVQRLYAVCITPGLQPRGGVAALD